jgi:hypothetical protein
MACDLKAKHADSEADGQKDALTMVWFHIHESMLPHTRL